MMFRFALVLAAALSVTATVTQAATICDRVAAEAAPRHGVPVNVMRAITRVETGHRRDGQFTPWPWTTNVAGRGAWHDSPEDARRAILAAQNRGEDSIDIGCFQINYRWHGDAFRDIDAMLDPHQNADYAARFLAQLYREFGSWPMAVGAFHSRTERFASRYRAKYNDIYAALSPMEALPAAPSNRAFVAEPNAAAPPPRENRYPLLQNTSGGDTARRPGSLMPTGTRSSPLFD